IPNQGAVVARLTAEQVEELFDVREVLEALAVRLATQNADKSVWEQLSLRFGDPAREAIAQNDLNYYYEAVNEFRWQTVKEAHNAALTQSLDTLYDRTRLMVRRLVLMPGRASAALEEHRRILDAMILGEAERAEELKRENIRSARRWFTNYKTYLL
ncbi:MAG: GntR family transcriptional regulator, partial [Pseudorhodobacter sp.]|nr:GntR family transcriptional regulator [Pseudorhodobacter sp.]